MLPRKGDCCETFDIWLMSALTAKTKDTKHPVDVCPHSKNRRYKNLTSVRDNIEHNNNRNNSEEYFYYNNNKTETIPIIVGSLGMIRKGTQKYVNEILENLSLAEIQKIVLKSTAHILRRTLSLKLKQLH